MQFVKTEIVSNKLALWKKTEEKTQKKSYFIETRIMIEITTATTTTTISAITITQQIPTTKNLFNFFFYWCLFPAFVLNMREWCGAHTERDNNKRLTQTHREKESSDHSSREREKKQPRIKSKSEWK